MTDDQTPGPSQGPSSEWRSAQHRVRNDMQTLASLLRLSRRRANGEDLPDEFALWLNSLAAVYDSLPLWDLQEYLPVRRLVESLRDRCDYTVSIRVGADDGAVARSASSVAVALAIAGLLAFACGNATARSTVTVNIGHDTDVIRIETVYRPFAGGEAGWPPLSLSMATQALDARYEIGPEGHAMVAVVVIPCR